MSAWRKLLFAIPVAACVQSAVAADLIVEVRDGAGKPVGDAVVYAEPATGGAPAARPNARAEIDQVKKEFVPRVTIVQSGTAVFFPNSDNIRHSIYSFSTAKTFQTKLYAGREAAPVTFDRSGVVILGCNIHDSMVAWVVVVDTPWLGKSGADGAAELKDLPPGDYKLTAAAPSMNLPGVSATLHVDGAGPLRQSIQLATGG